jgi:hypothetical protein
MEKVFAQNGPQAVYVPGEQIHGRWYGKEKAEHRIRALIFNREKLKNREWSATIPKEHPDGQKMAPHGPRPHAIGGVVSSPLSQAT